MRGSEESRKARKRLGRMESAISTLCFFLPRASTITSPVGGREGGGGMEEEDGAGEEGTGEEGSDGGGAGQGDGETIGGESGDVIVAGQLKVEDEGEGVEWAGPHRWSCGKILCEQKVTHRYLSVQASTRDRENTDSTRSSQSSTFRCFSFKAEALSRLTGRLSHNKTIIDVIMLDFLLSSSRLSPSCNKSTGFRVQ